MPRKDSCPDCYSLSFRRRREMLPIPPSDPNYEEGRNILHPVTTCTCRRCGWEGEEDEFVSTSKLSVKALGRIRSRMRRLR